MVLGHFATDAIFYAEYRVGGKVSVGELSRDEVSGHGFLYWINGLCRFFIVQSDIILGQLYMKILLVYICSYLARKMQFMLTNEPLFEEKTSSPIVWAVNWFPVYVFATRRKAAN